MLVRMTWKDIKRGKRCHCNFCPVALAVARALNMDVRDVYMVDEVYILYNGPRLCRTPDIVREFAASFDRGLPVEPITFELEGLPLELQAP